MFAIVRAPEVGWRTSQTWLSLGLGALLLVFFVSIQATSHEPLIRLSIFRAPRLAAATLAQLLLGAAWIPLWFFLNLSLQQVLGYRAFPSGAALLSMTILIMVLVIAVAPRLMARVEPRPMVFAGLLALAGGLVWLSFVRPGSTYAADVLPASLPAALGLALAFVPSLGVAVSAARPEKSGLARGIAITSYQIGSALGLAAVTAIAVGFGAGEAGSIAAPTDGYSTAFLSAAVIAAVAALLLAVIFRGGPTTTTPVGADQAAANPEPAALAASEPGRAASGTDGRTVAATAARAGWQPLDDTDAVPAQPPIPRPVAEEPGTRPKPATTPAAGASPAASNGRSGPGVQGRVRGPAGRGVPASLTLLDSAGRQTALTTADAEGRCALSAPTTGTYVLIAASGAHRPSATTVVLGTIPLDADLTLTGGAELTGTITTAAGAPISGAATTLTGANGEVVSADTTDTDGNYRLHTLFAGAYTFVVSVDGYRPIAEPITLPDTGQLRHDAQLSGSARLTGTVRAAHDGDPVTNARVSLADSSGHTIQTFDTDTTGQYEFTGLEAGDYELTATGFEATTRHPPWTRPRGGSTSNSRTSAIHARRTSSGKRPHNKAQGASEVGRHIRRTRPTSGVVSSTRASTTDCERSMRPGPA